MYIYVFVLRKRIMRCEVLCMRKCYILYIQFWFVMFDLYMLFFAVKF